MFSLSQWLQLAGVVILPCIASWLVTKGTKSMVDWDIRRYRQIDKVLEPEGE